MAKDDYFVIVYHICKYLYEQLKQGKTIDVEAIQPINKHFAINQKYWEYIISNLYSENYITGITVYRADDEIHITDLENISITPKGIEYLQENRMLKKVANTLRTIKEITPMI